METGPSPFGERVRELVPLLFPLPNHLAEVAALREAARGHDLGHAYGDCARTFVATPQPIIWDPSAGRRDTGKQGKIAEHGGNDPEDRGVALLVSGAPLAHAHWKRVVCAPVETTQIAPTILQLLGLDPHVLQAVQSEHTKALPLR